MEKKKFFTGHNNLILLISTGIVVLALLMSIFGMGMNLGIDFTGGSLLKYEMGEAFDVATVDAALEATGIENAIVAVTGEDNQGLQIRTPDLGENSDDLRVEFEQTLSVTYPNLTFVTLDTVGAVAGRDLIANAVKACLIVFLLILAYIIWRFDFHSGLAALLALAHDVLIMCSFMVFFRGLYQVNSSFIAAVLTIIGYSINNTIIIFDRLRENNRNATLGAANHMEIAEISVRETLPRTINTSITTLITLVVLFILGVPTIREFTFPLIVGMLAGVYSSVMISGQLWARWIDNGTFEPMFKAIKGLFTKKRTKKA